ncbi:MAG: insulinase family protein [Bacteroidia bacterium]|nr:insulinase family protein [Bacteroidia bacterium]
MKKISLALGFVLGMIFLSPVSVTAQSTATLNIAADVEKKVNPQDAEIPFDPETRTGTLENGLRYYIRKNALPENYAELRLAVNAGSIQETDEQQGLAHFVEHMCFNGTKNFPKSALVDYLESIGTKFGAHLNAFTSFDETVYMLRVPTNDEEKFNKGMSILEEWAHNVTFEGEEIDKERGVVVEEWRTRLGASNRIMQETLPKTFYNSRYADRLPIGKKEILENFEYETLRQYYRDWYRPDLMAVVAVGDFEVEAVEKMIRERFGKIAPVSNPKPREIFEVPNHKETLISIISDEEASSNRIEVQYKHEVREYNTLADYRKSILERLASQLIDLRLEELMQSDNPPFTFAYSGYSGLARSKDDYTSLAIVPDGGFMRGLEALLTENERAIRFGFTESELERAKKSLIAGLEQREREKDKTPSNRLVMSYVYHYLSGDPVPGISNTLMLHRKFLPEIKLEEVNEEFRGFITEENRVITLAGIRKEGVVMPEEADVKDLLIRISQKELEPYQDEVMDAPLMAEIPQPGTITETKTIESIGVTEITFANGVRVILKPTDFQNDAISMQSYSPGGTSLYSNEEYMSASTASGIVSQSGLGDFTNIQLDKFLADKVASVSPYISELNEGINGSCSPKDLTTFMQMVNLYFTRPRKDETAFTSLMTKTKGYFANLLSNPEMYFRSEVAKIMSSDHFRREYIASPEKLDMIKLDDAFRIYQERFADAGDFTFFFVGNFDVEAIKPVLATYLGSLPSNGRIENWKDVGVVSPEGPLEKVFYKGREPKSLVQMKWQGDFEWNGKNRYNLNSMVQVLRIMLRESMREDKGGVYGVGANVTPSKEPKSEYDITISFTCSPENARSLIETALKDIETLKKEGASEKNLQKVKEAQRKDIEVGLKDNGYWMQGLVSAYRYNGDPENMLKQHEAIDKLKSSDVKKAAKKYFVPGNYAEFLLLPEEKQER